MIEQYLIYFIKSIYKKHTQLGAIIETYSSNRKEARKKKFLEIFFLKKQIFEKKFFGKIFFGNFFF